MEFEDMAAKLRAAGWVVIAPEQVAKARDCRWCDEPHDGDCQCTYACGVAYCHWGDN